MWDGTDSLPYPRMGGPEPEEDDEEEEETDADAEEPEEHGAGAACINSPNKNREGIKRVLTMTGDEVTMKM